MTKKIAVLIICLGLASGIYAQRGIKVGYVDMDYILKNLPEYKQAQQQLDAKINTWRKEIEAKKSEIQKLKEGLENERPLLTPKMVQDREDEIKFRQQQLLDYQEKRFGAQGDMITQKRQLIQPIQDQVFNSVQEIGTVREYDFIFENTANALLLFSAPRHDISDQVLSKIKRSSRELERQKEEARNEASDGEQYKSVEQAAADKKEKQQREAERKAEEERRQAEQEKRERMAQEQQRQRDSIRDAKRQEIQQRRQKQIDKRERRRDSIKAARQQQIKERRQRLKEERKNRDNTSNDNN